MNVTIDPIEDFNSNDQSYLLPILSMLLTTIRVQMVKQNLHVMKKMIPSSSGTAIPALQTGVQESIIFLTTSRSIYITPDANSPINHMNSHSVEDFDNLGVVVGFKMLTLRKFFSLLQQVLLLMWKKHGHFQINDFP